MSVPAFSPGEDFLDTCSLMPENDYLWKYFGFSREYNPDLLKEVTPSDAEGLWLRDLWTEDDDDIVNDPHKGCGNKGFFYNECPFPTTIKISHKKSEVTQRAATLEEKKLSMICISFMLNSGQYFIHTIVNFISLCRGQDKMNLLNKIAPKLTGLKFETQYYCPDCSAILNFESEDYTYCRSCHRGLKISDVSDSYCIMSISLKEQLKELVNSNLYPLLCKKHNGSDVTSGTVYQEMSKKMGKEDLSLQWNVSKVRLSVEDPTVSTWLIQVMVNELPYRQRINNVFLCGFSSGVDKPSMNGFLHPFISELIDLRMNGLTCKTYNNPKPITIKFHTLFCTVEKNLRFSILNTAPPYKSYNCSYCMKQDKEIPFSEDNLRTSDLHMKHCELAVKCGKIVKGVQGPSVVMLHQDINIVESFPPDYVDTCLLGVCKLIVTSWFNTAYRGKRFYLGQPKVRVLNEKLRNTIRPCEVTRTPARQWNLNSPSDWRNFVLYYSQHCLKNLLPDDYYEHWMSLVKALHLFSKLTITEEMFKDACTHFNYFLESAYIFYGFQLSLSKNLHKLHELKHLPHYIQRYGALWAWSSFPYRRYDDVIQDQFQKSIRDYSPELLVHAFSELRYMLNNSGVALTPDSPILDQFLMTMNDSRVKGCFTYGDGIKPLGQLLKKQLQLNEKKLLENKSGIKPMLGECKTYARFVLNDVLFHSYDYEYLMNIDNSVFRTKDGGILRVVCMIKVEDLTEEVAKYVVKAKEIRLVNEDAHWYKGEETENIVYIDPSNIECKCFAINHYKCGTLLVIPVPNPFETY